jgi:hypothetical protein
VAGVIEIKSTDYVTMPCSGHGHVVQRTTLVVNEGGMKNLEWILNAAARGQDFAANGDMRTLAGALFNELGFGDDPSLWPEGRPE